MVKSTPVQSLMFDLPTWQASLRPISSPASEDGATPSGSQNGPMTDQSGPVPARASRSRSRAEERVSTIQGTCGRTSFGLSPPSGPLWLWESKLQARLATVGSTECELIWRRKDTPAGGWIFRLARWTPPTSVSGSIGSQKHWTTPQAHDAQGVPDPSRWGRHGTKHGGRDLPDEAAMVATWPTPRASEAGPDFAKATRSGTGMALPAVAALTTWPTPNSSVIEPKSAPPVMSHRKATDPQISTADVAAHLYQATWPTPCAQDGPKGGPSQGLDRLPGMAAHSGQTTSGSQDPTAKRGALNPAFPCWLMGFPPEWDACAPTVTPSSRKSRQK